MSNGEPTLYEALNDMTKTACELGVKIKKLEAEADWLAQAAANAGWHGNRVSAKDMREMARKAVEEKPCE